ncbi:MAG: alpha-E domain-containing protein [Coriobacteriia bacterium]|nr:alpha-E domain-containing protein [Coriobacteriia bacterium]
MGSLSLDKIDHLLWLGRYVERSQTTLHFIMGTYDAAIDSPDELWRGQLQALGFDSTKDSASLFEECLFGEACPSSIKNSLEAAYDNAVVLRDVIGTETIAYVQMAVNSLEHAQESSAPMLDCALIIDDIMAFKGCSDDYVADDVARNIIKCGFSIERMDLYLRLGYKLELLEKETHKLASRIDRIGIPYDRAAFKEFIVRVYAPGFPENATPEQLAQMLRFMEQIF